MENNNIRTFTIHAQEIKKEKQSFIACSAEINKKWYKIKFTKECEGAPKRKGIYELTIDFDCCSIERGKRYTNSQGKHGISNDIIWVREIANIHPYTDEELKASNRMAMSNIFGE